MKLLFSLSFVVLLCLPVRAAPPNIVVIISDDMGYADVGFLGSAIPTPHLDAFVAESVKLDRFYVNPVCSPTRISLLTGRNPIRFGVIGAVKRGEGIPASEVTLPTTLKTAGYQTWMCGKWHAGSLEDSLPLKRGFDHFYGCIGGVVDYFEHTSARGRPDWYRNAKLVSEEGYSTDLFADEAIRMMAGRDKARPFYLQLSFTAPHTPLAAPQEWIDRMKGVVAPGRETYAATIASMDAAIGRVLKQLEDEELKKDTVVLFFNDNGGAVPRGGRGRQAVASNKPLKHGKSTVADGGIRVAAAMRWPGVLNGGTVSAQLTGAIDVFPMLCAAANVKPPVGVVFDGENVWDALRSGKIVPRNPLVYAGERGDFAVLMDQWKYYRSGSGVALYDVVKDPTEANDLSAEKPKVLKALQGVAAPFEAMVR